MAADVKYRCVHSDCKIQNNMYADSETIQLALAYLLTLSLLSAMFLKKKKNYFDT